jgi:cytochrome c oxidase subunit 2
LQKFVPSVDEGQFVAMALAVALTLTLLTAITAGLFLFHPWWFPDPISHLASAIDYQFTVTFIVCGILFATAQLSLAYLAWRYRARRQEPGVRFSWGNSRLEHAWALIIALLFLALGWTGYRVWAHSEYQQLAPGVLRIEVWGEQFAWYFRYPGPDERFGPIHPSLMNDGLGNYLGLDREHDATSRDDVITTTLAVPVGKPVELILRSKDVVHSFFVRELRLKQDAVPGAELPIHFTAERTGHYDIICTELCGLGHYRMHAELEVMTPADFERWLRDEAAKQ